MPLHPVLAAMLEQSATSGAPPTSELEPSAVRENYRAMRGSFSKRDLYEVRDTMAGEVPIRIYRPSSENNQPCLIYFHGGGWVIGDLLTGDSVCRDLAIQAGCVVIATDYRLAPEHQWPAGLDDCCQVTRWVADKADYLGIDDSRIAVGGESAGGNLSACVTQRIRSDGGPQLVHQLLVCAVTDAAMDTPSYEANGAGYLLSRDTMNWFFGHYVPEETDRFDPMISPLRANDFTGLPPATVITAEFDPLRDEGEAYGKKLIGAGVPVEVRRFDGMMHEFFAMSDLVDDAKDAISYAAGRLRSAFDG
jgi:acetyl esterase